MSNKLKEAAKLIYKDAQRKVESGEAPIVLNIDGLMALIWQKMRNHIKSRASYELLDAASDALLILAKATRMEEASHFSPMIMDDTVSEEDGEDDQEEGGFTIDCPKCGEEKPCTLIPEAIIPLCDDCIQSFGDGEDPAAHARYLQWVKEVGE